MSTDSGGTTAPDDGGSTTDATDITDSGPPPPPLTNSCNGAPAFDAWVADPKMCLTRFAQELGGARQTAFAPNGDLFVAIQGGGKVVALYDDDKNGTSETPERSTFATAPGLNHGVAFSRDGKFLYASSQYSVFRWAYQSGDRKARGAAETVVKNMPGTGHDTRTLVFDSKGNLYVNVGSFGNVDIDPGPLATRGQVRRFAIPAAIPAGGIDYGQGEVFASGMRNEVGLFIGEDDHLWGVENGRDNLGWDGGDIHDENPGEEINWLDAPGVRFYGYPYCWSEGKLAGGLGPGTQWADTSLIVQLKKTDAWCRDAGNVQPPAGVMTAHWAPLGIFRYTGGSLPFRGDLLVTAHGSFNRTPASGRVVAHVTMENGKVTAVRPIVGELGADGGVAEGTWSARPVDVRQGPDGAVYFSDDQGGRIFRLGYRP